MKLIYLIFFFFEFPRKIFSVTLYTQRFAKENISYINSTSDVCQLPNRNFGFHTIFNFTLNNCRVNKCYAIIDKTYDMKWGNTENINPSAFHNISITGANYLHKSTGIIFKPTQTTINLLLQTQSCDDFYTMHPFEERENCNSTLPISDIIRGLPLCNGID